MRNNFCEVFGAVVLCTFICDIEAMKRPPVTDETFSVPQSVSSAKAQIVRYMRMQNPIELCDLIENCLIL